MRSAARESNAMFARGLARAFAGAVIFGLPLMMTMEMWWLGFHMEPARLALLLAVFLPFLVLLSWHSGFEPTFSWRDDVVDALVAFAVGIVASLVILSACGLLARDMAWREIVGKVSLQALPASIGALLAQTQLGERDEAKSPRGGAEAYASELFIMAVGALFLAFNLAPTDEMMVIALQCTEWQAIVLMLLALAAMHAFVYALAFRGSHDKPRDASAWSIFLRFTVTGYALVLLLCAWMLWSFGRFDGLSLLHAIKAVAVLAFPAAIGAAAARLIL
ncbi:TIGR02587 family membrane protein [Ramlibacter sp.]|jgi:putative integral membrane protein (TIGR02587 family)|uniref:TIGR02587 family membrane protein n=1 Tax=Ramlibacter sp. TaxID=1917967 RepID=UPI00262D681F|nr:TIGR02587 family membrane protein [Ramlibacter sp.]